MSQATCDRHYLRIPALGNEWDADAPINASAESSHVADPAVFRASLLYLAADLESLARTAPAENREQLRTLAALIVSLAAR